MPKFRQYIRADFSLLLEADTAEEAYNEVFSMDGAIMLEKADCLNIDLPELPEEEL